MRRTESETQYKTPHFIIHTSIEQTSITKKPPGTYRTAFALREEDQYFRFRAASAFFLRFTLGFS